MRAMISGLSLPFTLTSRILLFLGLFGLRDDLRKCLAVVDESPEIPHHFFITLVAAEDHRNAMHPGVDPISIIRVLFIFLRTGKVQGASTIEQQLVRTVLQRYEITFKRKFREQLIAVAFLRKRTKQQIASAYLCNAYYGFKLEGLSALQIICKPTLESASQENIARLISRLKYPEPFNKIPEWQTKIEQRVHYILRRIKS
jgi:monofunctional glycosyltransferase